MLRVRVKVRVKVRGKVRVKECLPEVFGVGPHRKVGDGRCVDFDVLFAEAVRRHVGL